MAATDNSVTDVQNKIQTNEIAVKRDSRFIELDSLRGLAAATVVLHHATNMWPTLLSGPASIPLRLFSGGEQAVALFFILSGFVLALPYIRGKSQTYPTFILRRILRIYGPYVVALGLAVVGSAIWHTPLTQRNWESQTWYRPVVMQAVLNHLAFIGNYPWSEYNTAFWSLVQEMRISIIFPLLIIVVMRWPKVAAFILIPALYLLTPALAATGPVPIGLEMISSVCALFISGILLAMHAPQCIEWLESRNKFFLAGLLIFAYAIYLLGHSTFFFTSLVHAAQIMITGLGAALILLLALSFSSFRTFLRAKMPHFLGKISYSLYLVHATVLWATERSLGKSMPKPAQLCLYLVLSLFLAWIFYLAVEAPFTNLSRKLGSRKTVTAG
ncbi:acyltransferase family protein [Terracidiphilus sp.]|uniref:acyltransferase family protein n=1 Tax=Terracidiphilus sp. TaxID=1964191 RepID=UPI003C2A4F51